jgi:hypothetical protein
MENHTHSPLVMVYVDDPLCCVRLLNLHIKTPITYKPGIPCPSSADSQTAQNSCQRVTGWHSQTTQSLSAYARQSNWQVAAPPQQSPPPNVRTPVKIYLLIRSHVHPLSILMHRRISQKCRALQFSRHCLSPSRVHPPPIPLLRAKKQDRRNPYS